MSSPASSAQNPSRRRDYAVVLSAPGFAFAAFCVVATLVVVLLIDRAAQVFVLLGAATTAAVVAAPLVRRLSRWMPRGAAIVILTLVGIFGTIAVMGTIAWDLNRQASHLSSSLHKAVADLPEDSTASRIAVDLELDERIDRVFGSAATRLVVGETDPVAVAGQVAKVVVVGVLGAFVLAGGRRLIDATLRLARRTSIREEFHAAISSSMSAAGSYLRRMIAVSVAHGVVAGLIAMAFGLDGVISIGAWVSLVATVPVLGGLFAWLPIVAVATVNDVPLAVSIAVALVCIVADRLARARWVHRALPVGPLIAIVGIGAGVTLVGVSGALLGLFVVALIAALASYHGNVRAAVTDLIEDRGERALPDAIDTTTPQEAVVAEPRERDTYIRLRLSGRTAATAVVVIALAVALFEMARSMQSVIVWFTVGGFIAIGLDRPIAAMHRLWKLPRALGTALVLGAMAGIVALVIVLGGSSITNTAATVTRDAPDAVRSMESLPIVGGVLERNGAPEKVEEFLSSLPDRLRDSNAVDRIVNAAGDWVAGALWTIVFLLAVLWDGPRLVSAVRDRVPPANRPRAIRLGRSAYMALSNVVAAAAFVAALNGTVVMLLALALGIPLAPILGLWAMAWNFIPQIGGFVGALPLVALGFGQGPWQGVIALVVFVTYQTFENHVIQPMIGSRVVNVPPLVLLMGVLFGGALAGFVGALMAGPLLGVGKVALTEIRGADAHRLEDRVGASDSPEPVDRPALASSTKS